MIIYQIRVEGPQKTFSGTGHFFSKKVFKTKEEAEKEVPNFSARCCGIGSDDKLSSLTDLEEVTKVKIVELELIE